MKTKLVSLKIKISVLSILGCGALLALACSLDAPTASCGTPPSGIIYNANYCCTLGSCTEIQSCISVEANGDYLYCVNSSTPTTTTANVICTSKPDCVVVVSTTPYNCTGKCYVTTSDMPCQ